MASWFRKQYDDIKGNLKWAILGPVWTAMLWAMHHLLRFIPHIQTWAVWAIIFVTSAVVFWFVAKDRKKAALQPSTQTTSTALAVASPPFDLGAWLKNSYNSTLLPEMEQRLRALTAHANPPNREEFYFKVIAVGAIVLTYDMVWSHIYRSQLLLLYDLNRRVMPIVEVKGYYDRVASDPTNKVYPEYSFGHWLSFLQANVLLVQHMSAMVEITPRGRDFLKYLVHCGFSAEDRKY
jgi:hypothetical protein